MNVLFTIFEVAIASAVLTAPIFTNMALVISLRYRRYPQHRAKLIRSALIVACGGWFPVFFSFIFLLAPAMAGGPSPIIDAMGLSGWAVLLIGSPIIYFWGDRLPWLGKKATPIVAELHIWQRNFGFGVFSKPMNTEG